MGFHAFPTRTIEHNARLALVDGRYISINGQTTPFISESLLSSAQYSSFGQYTNIEFASGLLVNPISGADTTIKLNAAPGSYKNFYLSVDVFVAAGSEAGVAFRTTEFNDNLNSYGYCVRLKTGQVVIAKGTNANSAGELDIIDVPSYAVKMNDFNTLEVSVVDNKIAVYVNGDFVKMVVDSTYTNAGAIGLYVYNDSSLSATLGESKFKNFYIHYPGRYAQTV
jgi:hypothetical protein